MRSGQLLTNGKEAKQHAEDLPAAVLDIPVLVVPLPKRRRWLSGLLGEGQQPSTATVTQKAHPPVLI